MEAEQEATIRAAVQTGGWEYSNDGSSDAAEYWRLIQNARVRNETAEEAEDPRTRPISVAWEMIEAQQEDGCMHDSREGSREGNTDFGGEVFEMGQG